MKKKRIKKIILTAAGVIVFANAAWYAYCGYAWSWGPFARLHNIKTAKLPGNGKEYDLSKVEALKSSVLSGKKVVFLGSSVTYGAASQGISFADYLERSTGCSAVKEAVSGTTLVEEGADSYIKRLKALDADEVDLFICQLSTNDASQKKAIGKVSSSENMEEFDTHTVAGAIEYIIAFAREKWDCPVMFNQISDERRALYMADDIHPTKAGYMEWWLPYMQQEIESFEEE